MNPKKPVELQTAAEPDQRVLFKRDPSSAADSLQRFKESLTELTGRSINDREAFEIIRLIDREGRTAGFPTGSSSDDGLGLSIDPKKEGSPETVTITFAAEALDKPAHYDISYDSGDGYLSAITKQEKAGYKTIKLNIAPNPDSTARNRSITFTDQDGRCPDAVKRFEARRTYSYQLTPPADTASVGTLSISDSRQYYAPAADPVSH